MGSHPPFPFRSYLSILTPGPAPVSSPLSALGSRLYLISIFSRLATSVKRASSLFM